MKQVFKKIQVTNEFAENPPKSMEEEEEIPDYDDLIESEDDDVEDNEDKPVNEMETEVISVPFRILFSCILARKQWRIRI